MQLRTPTGQILNFTILQIFPFTYESKRMGIIVRVSAKTRLFSLWLMHTFVILIKKDDLLSNVFQRNVFLN